jgi:hypothetical protein
VSVARGAAALVAAVALVLAGGGLAVALARANPAPADVLSDARHFVARARTVHFDVTVTTQVPAPTTGQTLVGQRTATGVVAFGRSVDVVINEGGRAGELLSSPDVVPVPGWLARGGPTVTALPSVKWQRFPSLASLEAQILGPSAGPTALDAAVLTDEASAAVLVRGLVEAAGRPRRVSRNDARDVVVAIDPASLSEQAVTLTAADGELVVADSGAPERLRLTLTAGSAVITASYTFRHWNAPVALAPPPASDIAA